jgi:hypothetical protein
VQQYVRTASMLHTSNARRAVCGAARTRPFANSSGQVVEIATTPRSPNGGRLGG